jgi:hypothetical protein
MDLLLGIFSAFGLSASAGLNAYIPLFIIGAIAHYTDWIKLAAPYDALANPWILILLGVLILIEFLADKIPAINHLNDLIQTLIRPVAGAIVFAAAARALTSLNPLLALASGLLVAGSVHTAKAGIVRPAVTATTGGAANLPVSLAEDLLATLTSFLAIILPVIIACLLLLLAAWLTWRTWKRSKARVL